MWLEELGQLKKTNGIGNRTHDLSACSTVPQPTTLCYSKTEVEGLRREGAGLRTLGGPLLS
jgi:hypothetical protein